MKPRVVDPARDSDYRPAELILYEKALRLLNLMAEPKTSGSLISGTRHRNADAPEPDKMRERWREYLERERIALRRAAADIVDAVQRNKPAAPKQPKRARRCPYCSERQREYARYCDMCGAELDGASAA